jgi:acyl-CoA reductase-like NAD-dependent aldehyde dehydrogenase
MPDFEVERAVSEAIIANCGDTGQRCVSLRAVFVHESIYYKFLWKYIDRAKQIRIGPPDDFASEMGPLASKEHHERVSSMVDITEKQLGRPRRLGVRQLEDWGHFNVAASVLASGGYYYPPTVFDEVPYGILAMDKEIFGPVLCVTPFYGCNLERALADAIDLINRSAYGLSNSVCTKDISFAMEAILRVKTGILYINRGTTGAELNRYFGGVKSSGWGREGKGVDDFTQIKQVYIDTAPVPRMAQVSSDEKVRNLLQQSKIKDFLGY